jgi:quercetin 2,3-dioxygenase
VQWMTAGDGIVHCEMPSQRIQAEGGRTHGFQLWVNLPAELKRTRPRYQALTASDLPRASGEGWTAVVIAGNVLGASGPAATHTPIVYAHLTIQPGVALPIQIPNDHQVGLYVFAGSATAGGNSRRVDAHQLAVFAPGDGPVMASASTDGAEPMQALLMAGRPLDEPVARHGPFVMNTREELIEALEDYQAGRMGIIAPAGV